MKLKQELIKGYLAGVISLEELTKFKDTITPFLVQVENGEYLNERDRDLAKVLKKLGFNISDYCTVIEIYEIDINKVRYETKTRIN